MVAASSKALLTSRAVQDGESQSGFLYEGIRLVSRGVPLKTIMLETMGSTKNTNIRNTASTPLTHHTALPLNFPKAREEKSNKENPLLQHQTIYSVS